MFFEKRFRLFHAVFAETTVDDKRTGRTRITQESGGTFIGCDHAFFNKML